MSKIILFCFSLFLITSFIQAQNEIKGDWQGSLAAGNAELRLVFHIVVGDDGMLKGAMDSPDQGATGIPASAVSFSGNKLVFTASSIGGQFEGRVNPEFTKINGTWNQGGRSFPLVLEQLTIRKSSAPKISKEDLNKLKGIWQGALIVSGIELRLVFNISINAGGELAATMDSPDQGATDIPVSSVELRSDSFMVQVGSIGGKYIGRISGPELIDGTWYQGGQSWPLDLQKVEKEIEINRPQSPKKPYPYLEEEVVFHNPEAKIEFAGTLTIPKGNGPFPAVIMVSGSGAQDRDETILQHKPFLVIADYLTRNGIAVLRFDDRGTGKSGGIFKDATSADFATDAESAFQFLKTRARIDPQRIGVIGHSEGGLIGPMIAEKNPDVAFVIMIAGPALPGKDIILLQSELIFRASGTDEALLKKIMSYSEEMYHLINTEENDSLAATKIRSLNKSFWDGLTADQQEQMRQLGSSIENMELQTKQILSPWFRFFLAYDPAKALKNLTCPVLAIYGEKDLQVPATENIQALEKMTSGKNNYTIVSLPGLNHLMQTADKGLPSEYGKIGETIAPEALNAMGHWLKEVL